MKQLRKKQEYTLYSVTSRIKTVPIQSNDQVLSYLFMRNLGKSSRKSFLEQKQTSVDYFVEHKMMKIKPQYDMFIQKELLRYKNAYRSMKKHKVMLTYNNMLGFETGAEYFVKICVKIKMQEDLYKKIWAKHVGKLDQAGSKSSSTTGSVCLKPLKSMPRWKISRRKKCSTGSFLRSPIVEIFTNKSLTENGFFTKKYHGTAPVVRDCSPKSKFRRSPIM